LVLGVALVVFWQGRQLIAQIPGQYAPVDIEYGARLYTAQCATCHSPSGEGVGGVNLRSGKFRNAVTDQDLKTVLTSGISGTGMPAFPFSNSELTAVVAYLRSMNVFDAAAIPLGEARHGQAIFERLGCLSCHRVNGKGSRVAPNLSEIGAVRPASALQRSLLDPSSAMLPINRPVRAVTLAGKVIEGRRLNEDTYSVQLIDGQEHLVSIFKSDLREYHISTTSTMPSYRDTLTSVDLADLMAYLVSLRGS
jgi:putative heme-binding domain-containing protein